MNQSADHSSSASTPAPAEAPEPSWHGHISLRVKGILSLVALVLYVGIVGVLITSERGKLLGLVQELEQVHRQEERMVQINISLARAILTVNDSYFPGEPSLATRQVLLEISPLDAMLADLVRTYPGLRSSLASLRRLSQEIASASVTKGRVAELRAELHGLVLTLDHVARQLREHKERLLNTYRETHDTVLLETTSFILLGIVVIGTVTTIFFTRLAWDIRKVGGRAMEIVSGYRGSTLPVTRGDELGELMIAINKTQDELRMRERQLELVRQQQFHHEKMIAVGSLASAIAHEINNPIAAIAGVAQAIVDEPPLNDCANCQNREYAAVILEQSRRIAQITRQISEFAVPQSPEPQLIDINSLARSTVNFIRFDKRYRRIDLQQNLDMQLPALRFVADHFTQILMNLLVNAADALENVYDRRPEVHVSTALVGRVIEVVVADNGAGMSEDTRRRAFDEYFTTKQRGKGSGLGLFLCKSLLESAGGEIELQSTENVGTRVTMRLPVDETQED